MEEEVWKGLLRSVVIEGLGALHLPRREGKLFLKEMVARGLFEEEEWEEIYEAVFLERPYHTKSSWEEEMKRRLGVIFEELNWASRKDILELNTLLEELLQKIERVE